MSSAAWQELASHESLVSADSGFLQEQVQSLLSDNASMKERISLLERCAADSAGLKPRRQPTVMISCTGMETAVRASAVSSCRVLVVPGSCLILYTYCLQMGSCLRSSGPRPGELATHLWQPRTNEPKRIFSHAQREPVPAGRAGPDAAAAPAARRALAQPAAAPQHQPRAWDVVRDPLHAWCGVNAPCSQSVSTGCREGLSGAAPVGLLGMC